MNAGVRSRGSPVPKSITSRPRARASSFQSSRRANGYCASSARTGESCTLCHATREEPLQDGEGPLELGDLDPLVDGVRVAGRAGAEVDGVEPARGEVGDVRPGLLRLHARGRRPPARRSSERRFDRDVRRRRVGQDLDRRAAADELANPLLGRRRRAIGCVAEVDRGDGRGAGITFDAMPAWSSVTEITSRKTSPSTTASRGSDRRTGCQPVEREADRVDAEPRPSRVRGASLEGDARVQVAEAAELQRVVGRLEADDERRLVDDRRALEHSGQRVVRRGRAPRAGRRGTRRRTRGRRRRPSAASSTITASAALHVARAEADDVAVLDPPGQVALRRDRVGVPGEQHERPPGALREDERLAVVVDLVERHARRESGGRGRAFVARLATATSTSARVRSASAILRR